MKLRLVDKLSVCNPWELIQGEKSWSPEEWVTTSMEGGPRSLFGLDSPVLKPRWRVAGVGISQREKEGEWHYFAPPLLSASLVLDAYQQLAVWLVLYSSGFQQTGTLLQVDQFSLLRWREIPEWLRLELKVLSHTKKSISLAGKGFIEDRLVTTIGRLELALVPLDDGQKVMELKQLWDLLWGPKTVVSSFDSLLSG